MPYSKRFKSKKKTYGKKRTYMKKWTRKRQIKKNSNRVLSKFRVVHDVLAESGLSDGCISLSNLLYPVDNVNLANAEFSSFAGLYDAVRPCGVKIKWIPLNNVNTLAGATQSDYKPLYTCADYNDTLFDSPTKTKAEIVEYNNMKFKNAYRPQKWYFKLKKQPQDMLKIQKFITPAGEFTVDIKPQAKFGYFAVDSVQGYNSSTRTPLELGTVWPNAGKFYWYFEQIGFNDETVIGTFLITYYYAFIQRR